MKKILLTICSILALSLAAWVVIWMASKPAKEEPAALEGALEPPAAEFTESENPVEVEIPELNPAQKANPFEGTYNNPFE